MSRGRYSSLELLFIGEFLYPSECYYYGPSANS